MAVTDLVRAAELSDQFDIGVITPNKIVIKTDGTSIITNGNGELQAVGGTGTTRFTFNQMTAAAVWTIPHNLGAIPTIVVTDSSGRVVKGCEQHIDDNNTTITFNSPFAGTADLSI